MQFSSPFWQRHVRPRRYTWLRSIARLVLLCGLYTVVGKASLMLAQLHPSASPVWPPTGIAIAMLLLLGRRYWPAVFAGAIIVNMTTWAPPLTVILIAIGNTLEALIGTVLTQRFACGKGVFERTNSVVKFFLITVLAATPVSATIGLFALYQGDSVSWIGPGSIWFTWWLGDAAGALIFAPLIVLWSRRPYRRRNAGNTLELLGLLGFLALVGVNVFTTIIDDSTQYTLAYLALLPVYWAAIRFGPRETVTVMVLLSGIAIACTLNGSGPFAGGPVNTSLLLLQSFLGVGTVTGLSLAAAIAERKALQESLEKQVADRTRQMTAMLDQDRVNLQRLRDMVNAMTIATAAIDQDLKILYANEKFCDLFCRGKRPFEMSGSPLAEAMSAGSASPQSPAASLLRMVSGDERLIGQELQMEDGALLSCDCIPVVDAAEHRGHVILCRDVTAERRADRAKSEFVSLASHQLRTPLTRIRWSMGRLSKMPFVGEQASLVGVARSAVETMAETIDVMLMISRIEAEKMEVARRDTDLSALFKEMHDVCAEECAQRSLIMRIDCPPGLSCPTDRQLLREMLLNMLRNSLRYTPSGGTVLLRAERVRDDICIHVSDTGIGIPLGEQSRVFQKFFRAQNAQAVDRSGIGLGLYLVHTGAQLLGGRVSFTSVAGEGTTFVLCLPTQPVSADSGERTPGPFSASVTVRE